MFNLSAMCCITPSKKFGVDHYGGKSHKKKLLAFADVTNMEVIWGKTFIQNYFLTPLLSRPQCCSVYT